MVFFFSSRRRHTRCGRDWSSDVCSSDLNFSPQEGNRAVAASNVGTRLVVTQCDYRISCLSIVGTRNCSERYSTLLNPSNQQDLIPGFLQFEEECCMSAIDVALYGIIAVIVGGI